MSKNRQETANLTHRALRWHFLFPGFVFYLIILSCYFLENGISWSWHNFGHMWNEVRHDFLKWKQNKHVINIASKFHKRYSIELLPLCQVSNHNWNYTLCKLKRENWNNIKVIITSRNDLVFGNVNTSAMSSSIVRVSKTSLWCVWTMCMFSAITWNGT